MFGSFSFQPAIQFAISQDKANHEDEVNSLSYVGINYIGLLGSDGVAIASIYKTILKEFDDSKPLEKDDQSINRLRLNFCF